MPWRLIGFILILALFIGFIALNLDHNSDISFGFYVIPEVPVFVSLFGAFVVGVMVGIPLTAMAKNRRFKRRLRKQSTPQPAPPKKKRGGRRGRVKGNQPQQLGPPEPSQGAAPPRTEKIAKKDRS